MLWISFCSLYFTFCFPPCCHVSFFFPSVYTLLFFPFFSFFPAFESLPSLIFLPFIHPHTNNHTHTFLPFPHIHFPSQARISSPTNNIPLIHHSKRRAPTHPHNLKSLSLPLPLSLSPHRPIYFPSPTSTHCFFSPPLPTKDSHSPQP